MLDLTLGQIVTTVDGCLLQGNPQVRVMGLSTDSRQVQSGELFIALRGERFDGHCFLEAVALAGAAAAVVMERPVAPPAGLALILTADTLTALGAISRAHRRRFTLPVIGITGSNGKTTTKDLLASVLERACPVVKTERNFNNEIGLPLTLLKINSATAATVVEMGMRGRGQIRQLARIALPNIAVVTNVGLTHLELLGTQANIARAKGELVEELDPAGLAVLNGDDPYVREMRGLTAARAVFYGIDAPRLDYRAVAIRLRETGCEYVAATPRGELPISLPLPGRHNILNSLAALAVAKELGFEDAAVQAGLAFPTLTGKRLHIVEHKGYRIIDDTYNASPTSVRAALEVLAGATAPGRRIAVLADMLELGPEGPELHRGLGEYAAAVGIDWLLGHGELAREYVAGFNARQAGGTGVHYQSKTTLINELQHMAQPGDLILIKGSRDMQMEAVVAALTNKEDE
ncbi:MAG: UDP-N-acetylmuramoyl-tripeptide--D-alanyl-D-alanine ligase [Bacillota bacterium]|jgi:UDP-N-acetylmuramoyl-tripeptide--D-alanyl-D-alanine ligase